MNIPDKLYQKGNAALLNGHKVAFLCSRQVPESKMQAIHHWVSQLSSDQDCIICGNHSYMEQEVFHALLRRSIPTILVLAEGLGGTLDERMTNALHANKLLIVTLCDDSVHRVSAASAYDRNELILSLTEEVVIGYCTTGGNIDRQMGGRAHVTYLNKTVYTVESTLSHIAADGGWVGYNRLANRRFAIDIVESGQEQCLRITQCGSVADQSVTKFVDIPKKDVVRFSKELNQVIDLWLSTEGSTLLQRGKKALRLQLRKFGIG